MKTLSENKKKPCLGFLFPITRNAEANHSVIPNLLVLACACLFLTTCCKETNPCSDVIQPTGKFLIKEIVGDTAFIADTIFKKNYVQFEAVDNYDSIKWKLGTDPRTWTDSDFLLSFYGTLGNIPVSFEGFTTPHPNCFPGDNGIYRSTQTFTLVEAYEKPNLTLSPLIGKYRGGFTDTPDETFTVRIEYFDSAKYEISTTGSKNFYWFSNMPDGFTSQTNAAYTYPELRHGMGIDIGYKSFTFHSSDINEGRAWLSNDTLYISYGNAFVGRRKFIGKKL